MQKAPIELDENLRGYYERVVSSASEPTKFEALSRLSDSAEAAPTEGEKQSDLDAHTLEVDAQHLGARAKSLALVAKDNCVEFEQAVVKCNQSGPLKERISGCGDKQKMYSMCVEMQTAALKVLGFARADSDAERLRILAAADDLMIEHVPTLTVTENMVNSFYEALKKL